MLLQCPNTYWKTSSSLSTKTAPSFKPYVDAVNKIVMGTGGTPTIPCSSVKARAVISKGPCFAYLRARATA